MDIKTTIQIFQTDGIVGDEVITAIENDHDFRADLVTYFRHNKNRQFVIILLDKLIQMRKQPDGVSGDSIMLACYLLGLHNELEDSLKIWEAKTVDFDTYCYIDIQLVPFAGVDETIDFLKTQTSKEAVEALEYVTACKDSGDFENLNEHFSHDTMPWFV